MVRVRSPLLTPCLNIHSDSKADNEQDSTEPTGHRKTVKSSCYARQRRYWERQRQYVERLESTVKRLRMDVDQQLIARHNAQTAHVYDQHMTRSGSDPRYSSNRVNTMTATDVVTVMRKCMLSFELGVQASREKFLESAMCSDVHYGDHVGRDSILEHWMRFSLYFDCGGTVLEHCAYSVGFLEQGATVGDATAVLGARLTYLGLATVFPRALADTHLRDKLLHGPIMRLPMTVFFQFDEQGKVCRYDPTVDFVTGLQAVLGDYRVVATTLQSANIDASGQVRGDLPQFQLGISSCCDHQNHDHVELGCNCRRSTSGLNKLSVAYLL